MTSISLRSGITQPPINLRRRSDDRKIPTQIAPAKKTPIIRSILSPPHSIQRLSHKSSIFPQNLDDWVHESAAEIVRNVRRAPLLVHVHEDVGERVVETEEAVAEEWDEVAMRWSSGGAPAGVMLVEEIGGEREEEEEERETRVWGILVQGKGSGPGRVGCYLLKTSRVASGLGFGCTHFSLTPVQNFRESARSQLDRCWLLS